MGLNKSLKFANTAKDDNDDKKKFAGARDQKSYIYPQSKYPLLY